jgi:hypothetical protein
MRDHNGRRLAYVYFEDEPGPSIGGETAHHDEARRIAANIAKLPDYRKRREGFAILLFEPLPFLPFPKLNERHCAENEHAQYYEYDEAIRRRRQIIWQSCCLHK